ncbi:hypothetical protein CONLIGDRAFT_673711 [Coniochaeta ligniaria NRRL 30616]|uniref:Uncharacterized protein n=1 Tax=Coniochaeta ligniaria NRRL 30616 TaxID=1408157 RepID=A0A1J7J5Y8_9PEZI|nr:hypothetical protein CONLIGDRAFT_673711 [Coniochaeta ligniaria NRRL 30616]
MSIAGSATDEDDDVLDLVSDRHFSPSPPTEDDPRRRVSRERAIQALQLEAQRRSAHYYLTEYLAIRNRILSMRAQVQRPSDEQLSDLEWIRRLIKDTTASQGSAPVGVPDELAGHVWELVVVRDQLDSDLVMLGHKLDEVSERYGRSTTWSMLYPGTALVLALLVPSQSSNDSRYRYLRGMSWAFFGLCSSLTCFCGLRTALVLWLRRLVDTTQRRVDDEPLLWEPSSVLGNLSSWGWSVLQFSMKSFSTGIFYQARVSD